MRKHGPSVADRARCGLRVELVRVVQNRRFRRARSGTVVVRCYRMEKLGEGRWIEIPGPFLDHAHAQMDVAEQPTLLRLSKCRPSSELASPAHVVQKRTSEQEIAAQAWVQLRGLAAKRSDPDRMLEEPASVSVVPVGAGCRQLPERGPNLWVACERAHDRGEPGMGDLGREELEEPVELVGVAAEGRSELGRIRVVGMLDSPNLHLEPATEALDTAEDAYRVAFAEALIEEVDVAPDARLDATARVGELEREVRGASARTTPLLLRDREHALHGPVLGELGDRGHVRSL